MFGLDKCEKMLIFLFTLEGIGKMGVLLLLRGGGGKNGVWVFKEYKVEGIWELGFRRAYKLEKLGDEWKVRSKIGWSVLLSLDYWMK